MWCWAVRSPVARAAAPGVRRGPAVLAAGLLVAAALAAEAQEPLRIGYFDIPPHVVGVEDGRPKGAAISYFEERIAPHFAVPFEWNSEVTAPTRLMRQLGSGEIDAMIFLGKTEERTRVFHYPDPFLVTPETLVFRVDHPIRAITRPEDLHGLTLGFLVGGRIPEPLRDDRIRYDLIAGKRLMERNVEKLLLGRIDAIYSPLSTALDSIIAEMEVGEQVRIVPIEFLPPVEIYTVFSRRTVSPAVVEAYNAALAAAGTEQVYIDFIEAYRARQRTD